MEGCEFFARADQVMRYAKELQQVASKPTAQDAPRKVRRYLQKGAKEFSRAACADNPVLAVERLVRQYAVEYQKGSKQPAAVQMLMQACQALAQGKDPAPITSVPR